jgi:hypothetical protein
LGDALRWLAALVESKGQPSLVRIRNRVAAALTPVKSNTARRERAINAKTLRCNTRT